MAAPWEQQPDEAAHIYEVARIYFDLGPRRSYQATADRCTYSAATIGRWARRHQWRARARSYDAYRLKLEDNERQRVLAAATRTEAQKWQERLQLKREQEWQTAQELIGKAREMLASPLEDAKWNWRDAGVLIDQAARLVRLAAGEIAAESEEAGGEHTLTVRVEYDHGHGNQQDDAHDQHGTQQSDAQDDAHNGEAD
jgi:hypothetical protein